MEQINWSTEWLTSLLWLLRTYVITLVVFALVVWLLIRRTRWGRQFWRLSGPYFFPRPRTRSGWRPLLAVALLLLFTLVSVRLDILLSFQGNEMYTALQQLDAPAFWRSLIVFAVLASINVALVLINFYVAQRQIINWRLWLNNRMLDDWLGGAAYHRSRYVAEPIDNPDQRIQEDITSFAGVSQGLALGAVSSMVSLVSFSIILWGLSGPLTLAGVTIPRGMVFVAYVYVIIATVIAFRIGRPLIRLNFLNELLTASYRYALVRTRENSENIAFYRGEPVEKTGLLGRFAGVIGNAWDIVFRSLKFQGFNLVVNQIAVVFPIILQARRYFSGQITLGDVTQTATAFGQVFGALSFFRLAYDDFASYRAVLDRLTGLLDVNDEARALPSPVTEVAPAGLTVRDLQIRLPDGRSLLTDLDLEVGEGSTLLITGPSGTGKTTLLRSMAGLWPNAEGLVERPADADTLFCSQQPYLPLGSLRAALSYPTPAADLSDDDARAVLETVQLAHLGEDLDSERDWSRRLSPGEQQRLSFGRILLRKPSLIFLDESTSAMDEGMEHAMYAHVREVLPQSTIVSVGHRSSLQRLHADELTLLGEGRWETTSLEDQRA